jgi:hypothetical protein
MLSADGLLNQARQVAALDDYGDMGFAEGLRVLVASLVEEAGLTDAREEKLHDDILRVLVNRLRMHADLQRHPEILEEEVLAPIFITSLPRTGSTKLHRMIASTGDFNAPTFWQAHNFAPFPQSDGAGVDPRIEAAQRDLDWTTEVAPALQRAHPIYANEADEALQLLAAGFNSRYPWAVNLNVPSYVNWVLGKDPLAAFRDLRALLGYLQWQHSPGPKRRWVLKTPVLFGFEAAFAAVFPGTDFIVTHRHPVAIWPSLCALVLGIRSVYGDGDVSQLDPPAMLDRASWTAELHLAWRARYPQSKVMDLPFDEIVEDEVEAMRKIYAFLDMEFTDSAQANLRAWLDRDAERGYARNTATIEEFGMSPGAITEQLSDYIERYGAFI